MSNQPYGGQKGTEGELDRDESDSQSPSNVYGPLNEEAVDRAHISSASPIVMTSRYDFHGGGDTGNGIVNTPISPWYLDETGRFRTREALASIVTSKMLPPLREPRYHHAAFMLAGLILASAMALLSGFDAFLACAREDSAVHFYNMADDDAAVVAAQAGDDDKYMYGNNDDDTADDGNDGGDDDFDSDDQIQAYWWRISEAESCSVTFRTVVVPACAIGLSVGVVSLCLLVLFHKGGSRNANSRASNQNRIIDNDDEYDTDDDVCSYNAPSDPSRRLRARSRHLIKCARLFLLSLLALAAWAYGIISLMLEPRYGYSDSYRSLAAVDGWGRVGDNANLYYSAWASLALSAALVYHLAGMTLLQLRSARQATAETQSALNRPMPMGIKAVLDWSINAHFDQIRESRATWYNSIYKLRSRTGIWVATLASSLVLSASSTRMWKTAILSAAEYLSNNIEGTLMGQFEVCDLFSIAKNDDDNNSGWNRYNDGVTYEACTRTQLSGTVGVIASITSVVAIVVHSLIRRHMASVAASENPGIHSPHGRTPSPCGSFSHLPLELGLSMLNVLILGSSAILVTGVNGPAQGVGNMYYSIWLSFVLSLRLVVECLEEMFNLDEEDDVSLFHQESTMTENIFSCGKESNVGDSDQLMTFKVPEDNAIYNSITSDQVVAKAENGSKAAAKPIRPISEGASRVRKERPKRLRRWGAIAVFSSVCAASTIDAANHEAFVSRSQRYMIWLPIGVALLCFLVFLMCLNDFTYMFVNDFKIGGCLSIITFWAWLSNMIVTMHSDDGFAVNAIGEIKMANLYYFSWASTITSGLQVSTYVKKWLGVKAKSLVGVMWFAIVKVSFVMLAGGLHIWLNIADTCQERDGYLDLFSFCSRTAFSIIIGAVCMAIAWLVMMSRAFCTISRCWLRFEMVLSGFFVIIFGVAVAVITTIGGPGQSPGDLYYATWLAFLLGFGASLSCYDEFLRAKPDPKLHDPPLSATIEMAVTEIPSTPVTPFQIMKGDGTEPKGAFL